MIKFKCIRLLASLGFPGGSRVKNLPMQELQEMWGLIPCWRKGNPVQYSCLGNPMDGRVWCTTVHEVAKSWTWPSMQAHCTVALVMDSVALEWWGSLSMVTVTWPAGPQNWGLNSLLCGVLKIWMRLHFCSSHHGEHDCRTIQGVV